MIDILYSHIILYGLSIGIVLSKYLDRGAIEYIGPYGLSNTINSLSYSIDNNNSSIPTLALYLLIAFLLVITITLTSLDISRTIVLALVTTLFVISRNLNTRSQ